jgi:hypothetical protein
MKTRNTLAATTQVMGRGGSRSEIKMVRNPITGERGKSYHRISQADQEQKVVSFSNFMDSKIATASYGRRNTFKEDKMAQVFQTCVNLNKEKSAMQGIMNPNDRQVSQK